MPLRHGKAFPPSECAWERKLALCKVAYMHLKTLTSCRFISSVVTSRTHPRDHSRPAGLHHHTGYGRSCTRAAAPQGAPACMQPACVAPPQASPAHDDQSVMTCCSASHLVHLWLMLACLSNRNKPSSGSQKAASRGKSELVGAGALAASPWATGWPYRCHRNRWTGCAARNPGCHWVGGRGT